MLRRQYLRRHRSEHQRFQGQQDFRHVAVADRRIASSAGSAHPSTDAHPSADATEWPGDGRNHFKVCRHRDRHWHCRSGNRGHGSCPEKRVIRQCRRNRERLLRGERPTPSCRPRRPRARPRPAPRRHGEPGGPLGETIPSSGWRTFLVVRAVRSDGSGCYDGSICGRHRLNINDFRASKISGTLRWRIDALPAQQAPPTPPPMPTPPPTPPSGPAMEGTISKCAGTEIVTGIVEVEIEGGSCPEKRVIRQCRRNRERLLRGERLSR